MKIFIPLILLLSISISCNKDIRNSINENLLNDVNSYLNDQILQNDNSLKFISLIKENIITNSISLKKVRGSEAIIVTLNKEFSKHYRADFPNKTEITSSQSSDIVVKDIDNIHNFLILFKSQNKIVSGNILEITSKSSFEVIQGNIEKIINIEPEIGFEANITFRLITQKYLYTILYSNEKFGYSVFKRKTKAAITSAPISSTNSNCTDWYLVSTYYFPDGSTVVTEQFLFTTCDNQDCVPDPFIAQVFPSYCDEQGGGIYVPLKKLCGNYNWRKVGSSHYAIFNNLYTPFSPNNNPSIRLTANFPDACVNIPDNCLSGTDTFSSYFNDAFNRAVANIEWRLSVNDLPPSDYLVQQALKARILFELQAGGCGGATFNNGGCAGNIPRNIPSYCPR